MTTRIVLFLAAMLLVPIVAAAAPYDTIANQFTADAALVLDEDRRSDNDETLDTFSIDRNSGAFRARLSRRGRPSENVTGSFSILNAGARIFGFRIVITTTVRNRVVTTTTRTYAGTLRVLTSEPRIVGSGSWTLRSDGVPAVAQGPYPFCAHRELISG
ncbi:MAG TPA: hypothetical protein VF883_01495 [Thermoanaerobaculia bacterium]|jgi:hypothetical protein